MQNRAPWPAGLARVEFQTTSLIIIQMNAFTGLFLSAVAAGLLLRWGLGRRHIRHIQAHRAAVPPAFSADIPLAAHHKAADYTCAKTRVGTAELAFSSLLLLLWTLGGALNGLDGLARAWQLPPLWTGTLFILTALVISALLDAPLAAYRAFGLEQRFGFNRITPKLFLTDLLKSLALTLLLGTPMIALALWLMAAAGAYWWLWLWLAWLGFSTAMLWAYPALIAPLFNTFRPLDNPALEARVAALLQRNGFASDGIFVMDGSARSTHGNAYFTGLGANKRIVFFDTLVKQLSHDEIEAVLAHELGHFKRHHVKKRMALLALLFLAGCGVLALLADAPWFYAGLGIARPSDYAALTLFALVAPAFALFLQPLFSSISRRHEFEADDFAAAQGGPGALASALVKLYRENANTLTPEPLYSAFHDSHPPAPLRIARLTSA